MPKSRRTTARGQPLSRGINFSYVCVGVDGILPSSVGMLVKTAALLDSILEKLFTS